MLARQDASLAHSQQPHYPTHPFCLINFTIMDFLADDYEAAKAIPTHILAHFPHIDTPIVEFVNASRLPPERSLPNPSIHLVFSKLLPSHQQPDLFTVQVASQQFTTSMRKEAASAWAGGARSLAGLHPNIRLPFWIITMFELAHASGRGKKTWGAVMSYIQTRLPFMVKTKRQHQVLQGLEKMVHTVGWNARLGPMCTGMDLLPLFRQEMINDRLVDSVAALVAKQVSARPECHGVRIVSLDFQSSLSYGDVLGVPPILLRELRRGINDGHIHRVIIPTYHAPSHWSIYLLDAATKELRFGDSLGWAAPPTETMRIMHWAEQTCGVKFTVGPRLHVPHQEDGVSCGIVMLSVMEHLVMDTVLWSLDTKEFARAELALRLCIGDGRYTCDNLAISPALFSAQSRDVPSVVERRPQDEDSTCDTLSRSTNTTASPENCPDNDGDDWSVVERPPPSSSPVCGNSGGQWDDDSTDSDSSDQVKPPPACPPLSVAIGPVLVPPPSAIKEVGTHVSMRKHVDRRAVDGVPAKGTLLSFFGKVSATEAGERAKEMEQRRRWEDEEATEDMAVLERGREARIMEKKRLANRSRQQKCRVKKKAVKAVQSAATRPVSVKMSLVHGIYSYNIYLLQTINDILCPTADAPAAPVVSANVAELSRPLRLLREQHRINRSTVGRKRVHEYTEAVTTNWGSPMLAQAIIDAGKQAGPLMKPSEICHLLKMENPRLFAKITPQVIGRYIERPPGGPPRWSTRFLNRVQEGNRPHGQTTRTGILVSCRSAKFLN
jgi:hypothetical protein